MSNFQAAPAVEEKSSKGLANVTADPKPQTTFHEDVAAAGLQKVYERHGRIDLDPMPSDDPNDPLNWPSWRKNLLLAQVAVHGCMGPFAAAAVIPAFEDFVMDFNISITQASYFVSVQIIFLGCAPLLFSPISSRIGRRPVFLLSTLTSAGIAFAGAYCNSYGTLMVTRVLQAIAISPPQSIGAATVTEVFFAHERGQKMGIWALLVSIGPPLAPLIMGFVVYNKSWQWIFYLLAIIFIAEFFMYLFFGPETLYDRPVRTNSSSSDLPAASAPAKSKWYTPYVHFQRHDKTPWSRLPIECFQPLGMVFCLPVALPALAYAVTFTYSNVLLTIETPALLGRKYMLNAQQVGLQFVAYTLGALLGEPIAGWGSDKLVAWRTRRANGNREPEFRLPLALPGCILILIGMIVFGFQLQNTPPGRWNVTPIIGGGIAVFGLQLITTVCISYAVESQVARGPGKSREAALFVAFFRQFFAFLAPFYYLDAFENLGDAAAASMFAALSAAMLVPLIATMLLGKKWRTRQLVKDAAKQGKHLDY